MVNVNNEHGQFVSTTTNGEEGRGSKPSISTAELEGITDDFASVTGLELKSVIVMDLSQKQHLEVAANPSFTFKKIEVSQEKGKSYLQRYRKDDWSHSELSNIS